MRFKTPRFWIVFFSVASVLLLAVVDLNRTSPGPLSTIHQREFSLRGQDGCAQCHGGFSESMTDSCLKCHGEIKDQVTRSQGLHGTLSVDRASQCALCHSDHHGASFSLVNVQSFLQAGIPNVEEFDHALVGYNMQGKHRGLDCTECHIQANAPTLPLGEKRYLGLDTSCVTCHEDPHQGEMSKSCTDCHTQEDFNHVSYSSHGDYLPLWGGHKDIGCRECHAKSEPHSLENLGDFANQTSRNCQDCHDSPHTGTFMEGIARLVYLSPGESCVSCHQAEHTSFQEEDLTVTREQHACSGFSLGPPHDQVDCASCHNSDPPSLFQDRYPGRNADRCGECHKDPHGGQFDGSPLARNGCISCHENERFLPHGFSNDLHARTRFALTDSHLELDCESCHKDPEPGESRVFHDTPARCELCHQDSHQGQFDSILKNTTGNPRGTCAECHSARSFQEIPAHGFNHGYWTGYPLVGAHGIARCESCHARSKEPDPLGRTFGRVSDHYGDTINGCITCHQDPHEGSFDQPNLPKTVGGRDSCERCHSESAVSFQEITKEFDHDLWTGFSLRGAHGAIECSSCHGEVKEPNSLMKNHGPAKGSSCSDCHEDPHNEQFKIAERNDCQRCHKSETSFTDLSFNHNLHSRFPLGENHRSVACSSCHRSVRHDDVEFVKYKPLGTNCVDCHGDNRRPLRKRKRGRH